MRGSITLLGCAALLGVVACAGSSSSNGSGSDAGATGGSGGTGGSSGGACPAAPPADGSVCTLPAATGFAAAHCSWGDDPRPACRTSALCTQSGTWTVKAPNASACASPALPAACPATPATPGTACSDSSLACWYPDGQRCWCSPCQGGSGYPVCQTIDPPQWACSTPPAGCPAVIPQAGTPCDSPGLSCGPDCELEVVCKDGVWQWGGGNCPICASPHTPIATPAGERSISELSVGDLVYSVDHDAIVAVPLARVSSTAVSGHHVVRVTLDSGTVLEISAGHPTADGRSFGDLRPGSALDEGHRVLRTEIVPYAHARTWDILPASDTGTYFAAGAQVASTLHR